MREIVSPLSGFASPFGARSGGSGGVPSAPTITSSDGDPASLIDNGDDTFDVIIDSVNVGTITQAQINAGGWITVVEPVVEMSGDDVVLTTTGFVIYVGNVTIETDVEVLADGVAVGTALPFDAAAYPDAALDVRFSFSVGADDLTITDEARAAPLKIAQFRDSFLDFASAEPVNDPVPWPEDQRTRRMTVALRVTGDFNDSSTPSDNVGNIFLAGVRITNNRFGGSNNGQIRYRLVSDLSNLGSGASWPSGADQSISFLVAVDFDAGLPGGETFTVWWSRNGAAPSKLVGETVAPASGSEVAWVPSMGNPNASGNQTGGVFDVHNHLWMANEALDPATSWSEFFNNDGTIKALPSDGVIGGITPVIFLVGDDFNTGNNRGSGENITFFNTTGGRTKPNVVNA